MSGPETRSRDWWASLDEWAGTADFAETIRGEFPSLMELCQVDRRELLRVMAASLALGGVTACKPARSDEAVPFVNPPSYSPGQVQHFATAVMTDGWAQPVLAKTVDGRPIKLEGNPEHPMSGGASSFLAQAALLDLYDPDRSKAPLMRGTASSWPEVDSQMTRWREDWANSGGAGLRLLIGPTTSPTLIAQLEALKAAYPNARVHLFDPLAGYAATTVRARLVDLESARVVVSIDDDFLGPGPAQVPNARGWASRRGDAPNSERIRLFMAEATPTLTGANAQQRIAIAPSRLPLLVAAIAARVGEGGPVSGLTPAEFGWASSAAYALLSNRGKSLLTVGSHLPDLQSLADRVNAAIGGRSSSAAGLRADSSYADLLRDMSGGKVAALFVLGANPAYASPGDADFDALRSRVPLMVHAGLHSDETAAVSEWHLPLPHSLEDWSDARSVDGLATIVQPVVQPLYDTRSLHSLLAAFTTDGPPPDARSIVRAHWAGKLGGDTAWDAALKLGFVVAGENREVPTPAPAAIASSLPAPGPGEVEIVIRPDPALRTGEQANNGWLQELPKPLTKVTWDNVIAISPALAGDLGIDDRPEPGHNRAPLVEVEAGGRAVVGPAWVMPGQPDGVVTVFLGYGRKRSGRVGEGAGYDSYPLRSLDRPWATVGRIRAIGKTMAVATTQTHHRMEGGEEVPSVADADAAYGKPADRTSIYPDWPSHDPAWGMVIDVDLCMGCNACVTACQSENNVPVVGKAQVYMGREMHWLRVSRLYTGSPASPGTVFQPVPCMHCEQAPCEMGCPVHATVHSPEGLNLMVYNRCIGTRTCSSFCPYKVRRFNWFDYTYDAAPAIQAQRNPDVTVRGRGVMEKCTYCIQRIEGAKVEADIENRSVRDGEILTACQQACPTRAITFGNLADAGSTVSRRRAKPRNYALLDELGTRPRTSYLARIAPGDEA